MENKLTFEDLNLQDRYTLLDSLPKTWRIAVEIGAWECWYSCHMMERTSMRITAIDPWIPTEDYGDENVEDIWQKGADGYVSPRTRYISALDNLRRVTLGLRRQASIERYCSDIRLYNGFYEVWREYSHVACPYVADNSVDFVYIDGEHNYEAVQQDMQDWWRTVKSGGILAGHDYDQNNPGTIQAVDEFVEKHNLTLRITGINEPEGDAGAPSWVIIKP